MAIRSSLGIAQNGKDFRLGSPIFDICCGATRKALLPDFLPVTPMFFEAGNKELIVVRLPFAVIHVRI